MTPQFSRFHALAALVAIASLGLATAAGQAQAPKKWAPERLADGQPNVQGTYVSGWGVPQERWTPEERKAFDQKMEALRGPNPGAYGSEWSEPELHKDSFKPPPGTVMVVDPPEGKVPLQPWALAKRNYIREHWFEKPEYVDSRVRCLPAGPRHTFQSGYNGWQVLQTPGQLIILQEHNHNYRIIPIAKTPATKTPHVGSKIELWMGDSVGHWEGNTLVVDVTNFTDKTWVLGEIGGEGMSVGTFHSQKLHMTERWTWKDANNVDYESTIEDPNVYTKPWKIALGVWKRAPKGYENYEYACHEGNKWEELIATDQKSTK
jgi:hypothetical protein